MLRLGRCRDDRLGARRDLRRAELEVRALATPNDPGFRRQWNLRLIGVPAAWRFTRGGGVTVAVIDTGVARGAPDFGSTRFAHGYDFVNGDDDPTDDHGHGTHVASTIAEATDNGVGLAGVAPDATILPLKVLDATGAGTVEAVARGVTFAVDHGARVINLSLGDATSSRTLSAALARAYRLGVTVVAAAGNDGAANVSYPGRAAHVITVGAVDAASRPAWYSNSGPSVDICAPGGDASRDGNGDGLPDLIEQQTLGLRPGTFAYRGLEGTSMATPHVAAAAAMILAAGRAETPDGVASRLAATARDVARPGRDSHCGAGLLALDAAVGP